MSNLRLLACCSHYWNYIYPENLLIPLQSSVSNTHHLFPLALSSQPFFKYEHEPGESHQGGGKKRRGDDGQSIDQLMVAGWGVTLLYINTFRVMLELEI